MNPLYPPLLTKPSTRSQFGTGWLQVEISTHPGTHKGAQSTDPTINQLTIFILTNSINQFVQRNQPEIYNQYINQLIHSKLFKKAYFATWSSPDLQARLRKANAKLSAAREPTRASPRVARSLLGAHSLLGFLNISEKSIQNFPSQFI